MSPSGGAVVIVGDVGFADGGVGDFAVVCVEPDDATVIVRDSDDVGSAAVVFGVAPVDAGVRDDVIDGIINFSVVEI